MSRAELLERVRLGTTIVVDLRPAEEYEAGHVGGALSIPLDELEARLAELRLGIELAAYCRGPFCALAPQGVSLLRSAGSRDRRLEEEFPEWRIVGLHVVTGTLPA